MNMFLTVVIAFVALVIFIRFFHKETPTSEEFKDWFGDARYAGLDDLKTGGVVGTKGIPVGLWSTPTENGGYVHDVLRYAGEAHLVTAAPSRSGKFRDVLAGALLDYEGSMLVIDPKGQMAAVTARRRREMGQQVFILNPFAILPDRLGPSARFNPMAALDPASEGFGADCDNLADAIVWASSGDSHWTDSARLLVSGLVMYLAAYGSDDTRHLGAVRATLSGPRALFDAAMQAAVNTGDDLVTEKLGRFFEAGGNKEIMSIISTAQTQTGFIGNKAIRANLAGSDFRFADMKRHGITVYLVLPTRYLGACAKWFRLVVAAALDELLREEKGAVPVLMMLDEFAQLGKLAVIENAMAMAAGYGVQLWPVVQDLTQLKGLYGESWETFLANAGVRQYFAPRDKTTSEYVSDQCGVVTIHTHSRSYRDTSAAERQKGISGVSTSENMHQRPLIYPDQARRLNGWEQLVFFDTVKNVAKVGRRPYWQEPRFQGLFDPDPYHVPQAPRAKLAPVAA